MNGSAALRALRAATALVMLWLPACNRQTQQQPVAESRPAGEPPLATAPGEQLSTVKPLAMNTQPAAGTQPAPATRPAEVLPASTFDTEPPYTVQLYVRKPEDKQPGWLKILALEDDGRSAKTGGVFPRQNRIEVTTENVRRLQVELGYLPFAEDRRVVLDIDRQPIEITQRDRRHVTLERRPTGQWIVEKPPKN